MVDHSIVIGVLTRTTNGMQFIARIYVTWDVLLEAKLSHYTIQEMHINKLKKYKWATDVHESMVILHIIRATDRSSSK